MTIELEDQIRLPISHPDYRYPASKNPYWTKLHKLNGLVFSDNETEQHKGAWRSRFQAQDTKELHVEIGCNAGHVILEWAKARPEAAFIGIDWKFKPIFRAAEKGQNRHLNNMILLRAHAERLPYIFGPQEIDRLYLFFPDPWAKKSQLKNRFFNDENLFALSKLMKPTGIFHIKTDHRGYFDWMLETVDRASSTWNTLEMSMDLHRNHPNPEQLQIPDVTLFEKLFIKDKLPIHSLKLQVKS